MTLQGVSNLIQGGISQVAAWSGSFGAALINTASDVCTSSMPALISRVGAATVEVFSAAASLEVVMPVGMYCLVAETADINQVSRMLRVTVAAFYLSAASLFYLSLGASWHTMFLAGGAMGAIDPLGFGSRLNRRLFPVGIAPAVPLIPVAGALSPRAPLPPEDAILSLD